MTTAAIDRPAAADTDPWDRTARHCWRILLVGWVVVAGLTLLTGERRASPQDLELALSTGQLQQVQVEGSLGAHVHGFSLVDVHWREGVVGHWTQVMEARPLQAAPRWAERSHRTELVGEDATAWVHGLDPRVRVEQRPRAGSYGELAGWRLPSWIALLGVGLVLATLLSLGLLPGPRRATRWAWFWLMALAGPIGVPAYLLLGGPTPGVPAPRAGARRLTGGLALLLAVVLRGALHGA